MNRSTVLLPLLLAAPAVYACRASVPGLTAAHAAAIRDSVKTVMTEFQRHSRNAQWDSLAALYSEAPGFRFLENGAVQYRSAGAIRAALAELPTGTRILTTYRDIEVDPVAPGVALLSALYESTMSDSTGQQFQWGGALSVLWLHETGGWRIRSGHSSASVSRGG